MDILDYFLTFYLNHLSPLWGYFFSCHLDVNNNQEYIGPLITKHLIDAISDGSLSAQSKC